MRVATARRDRRGGRLGPRGRGAGRPARAARVVMVTAGGVAVLFVGVSAAALMALPVADGETALGGRFAEAPVLGIVAAFDPDWLVDAGRYVVGALGRAVLILAMNGQMLGLARLAYSLATNRQIPSAAGRLHERRGTPVHRDRDRRACSRSGSRSRTTSSFLAGIFAFGAMLTFSIAHLSVIVLRFREPDRPQRVPRAARAFRCGGGSHPAAGGVRRAVSSGGLGQRDRPSRGRARRRRHLDARSGIALYMVYRRSQGKPLRKRFTIPAEALRRRRRRGVRQHPRAGLRRAARRRHHRHGRPAGRRARRRGRGRRGGGGALRVRDPDVAADRRARARGAREGGEARARARQGGGRGVRGGGGGDRDGARAHRRARRSSPRPGAAASRRSCWPRRSRAACAAERSSAGAGAPRDRFVGETTRYVVEKAPCKVILTAPPAGRRRACSRGALRCRGLGPA